MTSRWTLAALVVLLLTLQSVILESSAAPVDVVVNRSTVDINMRLALRENLTSLPIINIRMDASNSSLAAIPIQRAIQNLSPTATLTTLTLTAATFNATGQWTLSENYTLHVIGANNNLGTTIVSNLSFLFFNVTDPISVAGYELNYVTRAYILSALNTQPQGTSYYINGHQTLSNAIPGLTTASLRLLDFTWVPPISGWTAQQDILGQTTTWTFNPLGDRYNLTLGPKSPEGTLLKAYEAVYHPALRVTTDANAFASGNIVRFDIPSSFEPLMSALIVVVVALLLASLVMDRRFTRQVTKRRKR
jgi:hypothetical protein